MFYITCCLLVLLNTYEQAFLMIVITVTLSATGFPAPQSAHGSPQAGIPQSTPSPFPLGGVGGVRRTLSGWREWRRADPTLMNSLWRSKMGNGIRSQLGNSIKIYCSKREVLKILICTI